MSDTTEPNVEIGAWCPTCKEFCYFDSNQPEPTRWGKIRHALAVTAGVVGIVVVGLLTAIGAVAVGGMIFLNSLS